MNSPEIKKQDDFISRNPPLALKVWFYETEISEAIYKFWCKITGGKFERRQKDRQNSCVLVTKRGFHLISNLLCRNTSIVPSKLEAYQLDCPEKVPFGFGQTAYKYWFLRTFNCSDCGRYLEVQENDKKFVGKF